MAVNVQAVSEDEFAPGGQRHLDIANIEAPCSSYNLQKDDEVRDAESMFAYAARNINRLAEHFGKQAVENLEQNLSGSVLLSLYSGLGGAELSLMGCWQAIGQYKALATPDKDVASDVAEYDRLQPPKVMAACDLDPCCQSVLGQHAHAPDMICADLCKFIPDEVLVKLKGLIEDARRQQSDARAKAAKDKRLAADQRAKAKKRVKRAAKKKAKRAQRSSESMASLPEEKEGDQCEDPLLGDGSAGDRLLRDLMACLPPEVYRDTVECLDGKLLDVTSLQGTAKLIIVAGSVCKDWSTMNHVRETLTGKYVLPFSIMLGLVRRLQPMMFLHECVRSFRPSLLSRFLPTFTLQHALLEPTFFGFPVKRGRAYSALMRSDYEVVRDIKHIRRLYSSVRLDCGVFWMADEEEAGGASDMTLEFWKPLQE